MLLDLGLRSAPHASGSYGSSHTRLRRPRPTLANSHTVHVLQSRSTKRGPLEANGSWPVPERQKERPRGENAWGRWRLQRSVLGSRMYRTRVLDPRRFRPNILPWHRVLTGVSVP